MSIPSIQILSQQFARSDLAPQAENEEDNTWREWLFRESRRRVTLIYRVINMLIYFEPSAACTLPTELLLAPLPAKKELWQAADESTWRATTSRSSWAFGMASDGGLVKLDEGRLVSNDVWMGHQPLDARALLWEPAEWEEWCAGMDGMGGMIMLLCSLLLWLSWSLQSID